MEHEKYSNIKLTKEQIQNTKFVKLIFTKEENKYKNYYKYKINEINIANNWNPTSETNEMGGFNFSVEDKVIRWLLRGDTLFDVIIPDGVDVYDCWNKSTPHGVFRSNKIIIENPRIINDEFAMELYLKSNIPDTSFLPVLAVCANRGFMKTAMKIYKEKVNKNTKELAIQEFKEFFSYDGKEFNLDKLNKNARKIYNLLLAK